MGPPAWWSLRSSFFYWASGKKSDLAAFAATLLLKDDTVLFNPRFCRSVLQIFEQWYRFASLFSVLYCRGIGNEVSGPPWLRTSYESAIVILPFIIGIFWKNRSQILHRTVPVTILCTVSILPMKTVKTLIKSVAAFMPVRFQYCGTSTHPAIIFTSFYCSKQSVMGNHSWAFQCSVDPASCTIRKIVKGFSFIWVLLINR